MKSERFETPGHVRVEVHNYAGSVDVTTADVTDTEVAVAADREPSELLDEVTIDCAPGPDGHVVRVLMPRRRRMFIFNERLRVSVVAPHGCDLQANTASANVDATGRFGRVQVETASGNVSVDEGSEVRLKSASGDLSLGRGTAVAVQTVTGDVVVGTAEDRATLSSTSGGIRLGAARSAAKVDTVSSTVDVDLVEDGITATSVSGDVRIGCVTSGDVNLKSVSGDAQVGVAAGRSVEVDAQSLSGRLISEVDLDSEPSWNRPAGAARVFVKSNSVSGDLRIVRVPEPPATQRPAPDGHEGEQASAELPEEPAQSA
jgi:hypothetical protein